tara:strand:- start:13 stop:240 length:228 start_codon:yes stop_codon:yes gene_type:complete
LATDYYKQFNNDKIMKNLIQTVLQEGEDEIKKRFIVQFENEEGSRLQTINNYEDLTENEKLILDAFIELSENKMS